MFRATKPSRNAVTEYNNLVAHWNDHFSHECELHPVEREEFADSWIEWIRNRLSERTCERTKVRLTAQTVQEYKTLDKGTPDNDEMTRGELATLIYLAAEMIQVQS